MKRLILLLGAVLLVLACVRVAMIAQIEHKGILLGLNLTQRAFAETVKKRYRIACMGGSSTYGIGVKAEEAYPAQLQHLYPHVEVINAGICSYTIERIIRDHDLIKSHDPDLVILCVNWNDYSAQVFNYAFEATMLFGKSFSQWESFFSKKLHSNMPQRLLHRFLYRIMAYALKPRPLPPAEIVSLEAMFTEKLELLIDTYKDVRLAFLILPSYPNLIDNSLARHHLWNGGFIRLLKDTYRAAGIQERKLITDVCRRRGIATVDAWEALREGGESFFFDDIHLSANGCRAVAEQVGKQLSLANHL